MPAIEIIEMDADGGFDTGTSSVSQDEAPPSPAQAEFADAEFVPANSFGGRRQGFVFKTGARGLGYYRDRGPTPKRTRAATPPKQPQPQPQRQQRPAAVAPPPSEAVSLALWHQHGRVQPSVVEVTVKLGSPELASADLQVSVKSESSRLVVESQRWTGPVLVDLQHPVLPKEAEAWVHGGEAVVRVPVAPATE